MSLRSRFVSAAAFSLILMPLSAMAENAIDTKVDDLGPDLPPSGDTGGFTPSVIPEPASLSLLALGATALLLKRRK